MVSVKKMNNIMLTKGNIEYLYLNSRKFTFVHYINVLLYNFKELEASPFIFDMEVVLIKEFLTHLGDLRHMDQVIMIIILFKINYANLK